MSKSPVLAAGTLVRGTLILTVSGLLTRLLGFFYRIFLADALGAETLGIYQLIFPVYGLCFTLFAAGNQTALSKLIASHPEQEHRSLLVRTLVVSFSLAMILCLLLVAFSPFTAKYLLLEPRSADSLRLLAWSFPFCAVTSSINGYYYGRKKTLIPAATQLLEQLTRLGAVWFIVHTLTPSGQPFTCELAVLALVVGEIASMLFNSLTLPLGSRFRVVSQSSSPLSTFYRELAKVSLPITGNRFTINLLHSVEVILLPAFLRLSGIPDSEALSLYGILNGMAIPLILFPSTLTNSLSVLLLPAVASASAGGRQEVLRHTVFTGLRYSILVSILCTGIFLTYGADMGTLIFHNTTAGSYITTMAWLCPFLYLNTTLGSILNGLDLAPTVFLQNVLSSSLRILFLLFLVPRFGITGYLWGMLAGSLCLTFMHSYTLYRSVSKLPLPGFLILGASLTLYAGIRLSNHLPMTFLTILSSGNDLIVLVLRCLFICLIFLLYFLAIEHRFRTKKDTG